MESKTIGILGDGSWATALAKIICESGNQILWWIRTEEAKSHFMKFGHNPQYLSTIYFSEQPIIYSNDINEVVEQSEILIVAIPSAYVKTSLSQIQSSLNNKIVVSAVKGILPDLLMLPGQYLMEYHDLDINQFGVITGPCHAEEVALERLSYLTIASENKRLAKEISETLENSYIKTIQSKDVSGIEYTGVLKNIYATAVGIAHGLGYGDNFTAVLISNAIREMNRFLSTINPISREINHSAYLGDLLVTAYSLFSRNRMFGTMIGKGYTVRSAQMEMNMVAEGYYATNGIYKIKKQYAISMPIAETVYRILYEKKSARKEFKQLTHLIN